MRTVLVVVLMVMSVSVTVAVRIQTACSRRACIGAATVMRRSMLAAMLLVFLLLFPEKPVSIIRQVAHDS